MLITLFAGLFTATKKWFAVKCKFSPGPLHSHAACKLPSSMLLFGGERNGELVNELWRFHFGERFIIIIIIVIVIGI